ncbi:TPA: ATP-binding protein [Candidatus Micrarchaeota archaeon]|nr:ATP-binding protein [Candidatus Micrarchaeota archaeon]
MMSETKTLKKVVGVVVKSAYDPKTGNTVAVIKAPDGRLLRKKFAGQHDLKGAVIYYDVVEKAYRISYKKKSAGKFDMSSVQRQRIGTVAGDTNVHEFTFRAVDKIYELDFVVTLAGDKFALAQIVNIRQIGDTRIAHCKVLQHIDRQGQLMFPREPVTPRAPVFKATEHDLKRFFEAKKGLYIGHLYGTTTRVFIDQKQLIVGGLAIFGVRRSGKSYATGVIIEELIESGFPVVAVDPHGEYIFKYPNDNDDEAKLFKRYGIQPKGYEDKNTVFALDPSVSEADKVIDIDDLERVDFYRKHIKPGHLTTIVTKGLDRETAIEAVYSVTRISFELRKKRVIPPYFLAIDEVHNFAPQQIQGYPTAVKQTRNQISTIASEGGKFGVGFVVITQRPAHISKSVVGPLQNFMITRVQMKNDREFIKQSVPGAAEYMPIIERLPVGKAYISGVTRFPALVSIRVRRSKHFGASVDVDQMLYETTGGG